MNSPKDKPFNKRIKTEVSVFDRNFMSEFRQKGYIRKDIDIVSDVYSFNNHIRMRFENREGDEIIIILRSKNEEKPRQISKMGE